MNKTLFKMSDIVALSFCISFYFFWIFLLTIKYNFFGYYDWDLDLYAQAMWNLCHGSTFTSLFGTSFLANHANYIAFILTPVYFFFQHPLTLIHLKLFSFFAGAFVFYKLAARSLPAIVALIFMLLYIFHPPNIFMLLFEFDFETLSIGFFFLLFYFYQKENFFGFILTAFLAAICKENLPFVIVFFGLYALFFKKEKKWLWAGSTIALGSIIFIAEIFILTPLLRHGLTNAGNIYLSGYLNTAQSPQFLQKFFSYKNLFYLRDVFGPGIVLAFLSPQTLLISLPLFIQNLISSAYTMHTVFFHYAATIVPFIFMAMIHSLQWLYPRLRQASRFLLVAFLAIVSVVNIIRYEPFWQAKIDQWVDRLDPIRSDLMKQIPRNASVVTTFELLDHLSQRKQVYALYNVWIDANYFTGEKPFHLPDLVDHAFIDFSDPWLKNDFYSNPKAIGSRLGKIFLDEDWQAEEAVEDLVIFRKKYPRGFPLISFLKEPSRQGQKMPDLTIDDRFVLDAFEIQKNTFSYPLLPVVFFWNADYETADQYAMILKIRKDAKLIYVNSRDIGYALYPTSVWKPGEYIQERYFYLLPPLARGKYTLEISFWNVTRKKAAVVSFKENNQIKKSKAVIIGDLYIKG